MQVLNEFCFYVISLFYILFTDINPVAENKLMIGWFIVAIAIMNLIWPNGYTMVSSIWPDIKGLCVKHSRVQPTEVNQVEQMNQKRKALVKKYDLQLKD
jgi:hypothetical protein